MDYVTAFQTAGFMCLGYSASAIWYSQKRQEPCDNADKWAISLGLTFMAATIMLLRFPI